MAAEIGGAASVNVCHRRRIQVLEQAQHDLLSPLETKASRRNIPVGEWVLADIAALLDQFGPGSCQLVMSTAHGGFVHRNGFGEMWRRAVRLARTCGKPAATSAEEQDQKQCAERCAHPAHTVPHGTRFHDLRHFYASALIAALNPKVIQARLGHATLAETMDT